MFSRKTLYFVLPLIILMLMACQISGVNINTKGVRGSGTLKTEDRSVSGFDRISLSGLGQLNITQGADEKLSIEAEDNLLQYITTEVVGSELRIGIKEGYNINPTKSIRYNLSVKNVNRVGVSGAADVQSDSLKADTLTFEVSGAGKVAVKALDVKTLNVNSSGAGTFSLAGTANSQSVSLSGGGNYQAGDLKSGTASVTVSGAGNGTLWATDSLNVQISGLGNLSYYGSPNVTQNISGAGRVQQLGEHK